MFLQLIRSPLTFTLTSLYALTALAAADVAIYQSVKPKKAFLESDVYLLEPDPVIVRPGQYIIRKNGLILIDDEVQTGDKHVYIEVVGDWIEPIPLIAALDKVRVAVLQGTGEWAPPGDLENWRPLQLGEEVPVGSAVRVGEKRSCVGLDIGARHAVCLIPGSEGVITRNRSDQVDKIEIELSKGAVFSHVNLKKLPTDYTVRTPQGIAAARGTDFVTVALPGVTDVWIQEGIVELFDPQNNSVGTVSSLSGGAPKIIRFPPVDDDLKRIEANSTTLTAAATLIPQLNQRLPAIREKQSLGQALSEEEKTFLTNSKRMHYLIKAVPMQF
jgi:hypothetical protein